MSYDIVSGLSMCSSTFKTPPPDFVDYQKGLIMQSNAIVKQKPISVARDSYFTKDSLAQNDEVKDRMQRTT